MRFMTPVFIKVEAGSLEVAAKAAVIIGEHKGWRLLGVATPEEWSKNGIRVKDVEEVKS